MFVIHSAKSDNLSLRFLSSPQRLSDETKSALPFTGSITSQPNTQNSSCNLSIHHRRTMSRKSSSSQSPSPPVLSGFSDFQHSRVGAPITVPTMRESDKECWEQMLKLQREFHCYNSARLEAAVEALDMGAEVQELPMPSRLCLDLLNEELKSQIQVTREGY